MSETLSGITQLKIGDICLFIMCVDVRMSFCTLTLPLGRCSQTSLKESYGLSTITHIILEIELLTALNSFVGAVNSKTYRSSISIRVSGGGKLIRYLS